MSLVKASVRALGPLRAAALRALCGYAVAARSYTTAATSPKTAEASVSEDDLSSLQSSGVPKRVVDVLRRSHDPAAVVKYLASLVAFQSANMSISALPDDHEARYDRYDRANPQHYSPRAIKSTSGGAAGFAVGAQVSSRPARLRPVSYLFPTLRAKRYLDRDNFGELPQSVATTVLTPDHFGVRPAFDGTGVHDHPDKDTQLWTPGDHHGNGHEEADVAKGAAGFSEKKAEHDYSPYVPPEKLRIRPRVPTPTLPGGVGPAVACLTKLRAEPPAGNRIYINHIRRALLSTQASPSPSGAQVAVVLSGSGVYDGSEIHEAVSILVHLSRHGVSYQCFAPNKPQSDVINHLTGIPVDGAKRNVLEEAARIARGDIKPLKDLSAQSGSFDAIILPGGYGAAKNLSTYAAQGTAMKIDPDLEAALRRFRESRKPIGMCCIAPIIAAKLFPGCQLTLGADSKDSNAAAGHAEQLGARHVATPVTEAVIDEPNKVVTAPAYMYDAKVHQVYEGIGKMVEGVLKLIDRKKAK